MAMVRVCFVLLAALVAVGLSSPVHMKLATADTERVTFEGHKVFSIVAKTEANLRALVHLRQELTLAWGLDWWKDSAVLNVAAHVRVSKERLADVRGYLKANQLDYDVFIDDVQQLVDQQLADRVPNAPFNFTQYNTLEDVEAWVQSLPTQFPNLATVIKVGSSFEGRDILAVRVSGRNNGTTKIAFWFDGGIHAREWISVATVTWMLNAILTGYNRDSHITQLVDSMDFYILPVFNPDGYKFTWTNNRMWRKTRSTQKGIACVGVDPNRNWDFHWGEAGASPNPCADDYQGPNAFSEVETKSVGLYIKNNPQIYGYINFHSYSQLWMSPWGYTDALPKDYTTQNSLSQLAVAALAKVHGTRYQYGPIATTIYPASGSSADYTYGECAAIYSYGVELRDTGQYGFLLPANQIQPSGEETLAAILTMGDFLLAHPPAM